MSEKKYATLEELLDSLKEYINRREDNIILRILEEHNSLIMKSFANTQELHDEGSAVTRILGRMNKDTIVFLRDYMSDPDKWDRYFDGYVRKADRK